MFGTKHLKTNQLQKTFEYKRNKRSRLENIRIEICNKKYKVGKISTGSS